MIWIFGWRAFYPHLCLQLNTSLNSTPLQNELVADIHLFSS